MFFIQLGEILKNSGKLIQTLRQLQISLIGECSCTHIWPATMGSQTNEQERTNFAAVSSTSLDTRHNRRHKEEFLFAKKGLKKNEPQNCGLK